MTPLNKKTEGGKLKIVNVNCFRCGFRIEVSDKTNTYRLIYQKDLK